MIIFIDGGQTSLLVKLNAGKVPVKNLFANHHCDYWINLKMLMLPCVDETEVVKMILQINTHVPSASSTVHLDSLLHHCLHSLVN